MPPPTHSPRAPGFASTFGWRRLLVTLAASITISLPMAIGWDSGWLSLIVRDIGLGMLALLAFGVFELWPRRLPPWLARWVLQVAAVALAMPLGSVAIYLLSTPAGAPPFWVVQARMMGFVSMTFGGLLVAPWVALSALVWQKDAWARHQALTFDLERSELRRQALDSRLRLLQAQIQPHFLFNTLANVRELVDSGAPQASPVLGSLIAYLRAAVPRLQDARATLGQEVELVRAYLELMYMRMPDRLRFALSVDDEALELACPPTTLLTLVENAIRHGIDPSEEGGRVDIVVRLRGDDCHAQVVDTGVGLRPDHGTGGGTGLATLRERLRLVFGEAARLRVVEHPPHGVLAEIHFPIERRPV